MRTDVGHAVGSALLPLLDAFQILTDRTLQTVWQIESDGSLDRIIFEFDGHALIVSAVPDDDTIDFRIAAISNAERSDGLNVTDSVHWKDFVGIVFGWGWVTVNQQGYCDGMLLSFGGIVPQIMLNVMASSIMVGRICMRGRTGDQSDSPHP